MPSEPEKPLFEADPKFAAEWFIDDPLAQGAFRHASVTILEEFCQAADEIARREPDLDDFGPLGFLPAVLRPALTPLLVNKLAVAATVMGWKLSQAGPPNRPACLAEEFVLELIRREAVFALELMEADRTSVAATHGVYEVCEDDDVLDLFAMQEPADAALALGDPVNQAMGKADMRIEHWFDPFFGDGPEVLHPIYREQDMEPVGTREEGVLVEISPTKPFELDRTLSKAEFRVIVRFWEDAFIDRHPAGLLPATWVYYLKAASAEAAMDAARADFPNGAATDLGIVDDGEARLDREDLARISIDIQRVGLPQEFSDGRAFHIVGQLASSLDADLLCRLAANFDEAFPGSVVMSDGEGAYFGVSVNAESHEEAEAAFEELVEAFEGAAALEDYPVEGNANGQGKRSRVELIEEIESFRHPRR